MVNLDTDKFGRRLWWGDPTQMAERPKVLPMESATVVDYNLIGSVTHDGTHVPVLDIDFEARLLPSSTEGHFHLYLDGMPPLPWWKYRILLAVLAWAGVIEKGYAYYSNLRKQTVVRAPHLQKTEADRRRDANKRAWSSYPTRFGGFRW